MNSFRSWALAAILFAPSTQFASAQVPLEGSRFEIDVPFSSIRRVLPDDCPKDGATVRTDGAELTFGTPAIFVADGLLQFDVKIHGRWKEAEHTVTVKGSARPAISAVYACGTWCLRIERPGIKIDSVDVEGPVGLPVPLPGVFLGVAAKTGAEEFAKGLLAKTVKGFEADLNKFTDQLCKEMPALKAQKDVLLIYLTGDTVCVRNRRIEGVYVVAEGPGKGKVARVVGPGTDGNYTLFEEEIPALGRKEVVRINAGASMKAFGAEFRIDRTTNDLIWGPGAGVNTWRSVTGRFQVRSDGRYASIDGLGGRKIRLTDADGAVAECDVGNDGQFAASFNGGPAHGGQVLPDGTVSWNSGQNAWVRKPSEPVAAPPAQSQRPERPQSWHP